MIEADNGIVVAEFVEVRQLLCPFGFLRGVSLIRAAVGDGARVGVNDAINDIIDLRGCSLAFGRGALFFCVKALRVIRREFRVFGGLI